MIGPGKIKNLEVPPKLIELINRGTWQKFLPENLSSFVPFLTDPVVFLKSLEEIKAVSENYSLLNEDVLGIKSSQSTGGFIDFPFLDIDNSLFIAINKYPGDDSAIVMDYRNNIHEPRIVASDFNGNYSHCEWRIIADTFDAFCEKIGLTMA